MNTSSEFCCWDVIETYVDQSRSATNRTKKRPACDRMVAAYHVGAFDAIICHDLDLHPSALAVGGLDRRRRAAGPRAGDG